MFKDCVPQSFLGPFLKTLSHFCLMIHVFVCSKLQTFLSIAAWAADMETKDVILGFWTDSQTIKLVLISLSLIPLAM